MWGPKGLKGMLLVSFLIPAPLLAQGDGTKVGVIDVQRAVAESGRGQEVAAQLQAYGEELSAAMEEARSNLTEAQERLQTQERALSTVARNELNRTIQNLAAKLQRDTENANLDMQVRQDELLQPIFDIVSQVLETYAEEQRYGVILQAADLIYIDSVVDITTEIIRRTDAIATPAP